MANAFASGNLLADEQLGQRCEQIQFAIAASHCFRGLRFLLLPFGKGKEEKGLRRA
jgi:hypothetical protein